MKHRVSVVFAAMFLLTTTLLAQSAGELYQQGLVQENGVGNLQNAIQLYQRAAKASAGDRALAALALMGAARCYEKLGEEESRKLYEQVIRSYPDQREQVERAQSRINEIPRPTTIDFLTHSLQAALARRDELKSRYMPNHPDVITLDREIQDLQKALMAASKQAGLKMIGPGVFAAGPSAFDVDKPITITGTVKGFDWTNPNTWLVVDVNGHEYKVQGKNPRILIQLGWTKQTLRVGDLVTIEGFSATDGSPTIGFAVATLPDGRRMSLGDAVK
jgi:tetratricopeptide (TPR) repeat protein